MKEKILTLITILIFSITGCKEKPKVYSESDSQIELHTIKQADLKDIRKGYLKMSTRDGRFWDNVYPAVEGLPDSLSDTKLYFFPLNNIQALYQSYKAGVVDREDFLYYYKAWNSDTTYCSENYVKTHIVIATGSSKKGQRYYLFDSDNDYDLKDEIPYETTKNIESFIRNTNLDYQPHKVIFEDFVDTKIMQDSTWIAFCENKDGMWLQFCEKASATFQFDLLNCKIEIEPNLVNRYRSGSTFKFFRSFNKKSKTLKQGEFIKLGKSFYRVTCSRDGSKVTLTKDKDALTKGSTQVGMLPIQFKAKTLEGDSIKFPSDYNGKYVLLDFWALSCAPCIQEIKDYYIDIYKKYGGKNFEIIGVADDIAEDLESFIEENNINWIIVPDKELRLIINKYQVDHFPTLYLIDPEGYIIADDYDLRGGKFESILEEDIKNNAR